MMSAGEGHPMKESKWFLFLVPNSLTLSRLAVGIAFPWVPPGWRLGLLLYGALTDLIDGWISRSLHAESTAGQILDPIADKTIVLAVVGTLLWEGTLPLWELALVAQRDILVLLISLWILLRNWRDLARMKPVITGKVATAFQFAYLLYVLFDPPSPRWLLVLTALSSGLAGLHYLGIFVRKLGQDE